MNLLERKLSRRNFLKSGLMGAGLLALRPLSDWAQFLQDFPQAKKLGRIFAKLELKSRPSQESKTLGVLYDDAIVISAARSDGRSISYVPY